jgi:hypothetical protein
VQIELPYQAISAAAAQKLPECIKGNKKKMIPARLFVVQTALNSQLEVAQNPLLVLRSARLQG